MVFHILLPRKINLVNAAEMASRREAPRHAMWLLAEKLHATIHEPDDSAPRGIDRGYALIAPPTELWTLARRLSNLPSSDVVFCPSEAGGLQLAAACSGKPSRPRIAMFVHNVNRPRARFAMRWWHMTNVIDLFMACSENQVNFLRYSLNVAPPRATHVVDHTDTHFFTPGVAFSGKLRPLIVSVGLEQRDYKTLAAATHDLAVDVRISGFSNDAAAIAQTFPVKLPNNMSRQFYEWPQLVQLYRDADIVVISCHENAYAAGVQSLMEATACARPVVVTSTEGLRGYIDDSMISIRPGDAPSLRHAIVTLLSDPSQAEMRATRGREVALRRYDMDRYVAEIEAALRTLV